MNKEDYGKYYIQGSDHYLIPKDVFNELFDEMENWREEAKVLKKHLEAKVFVKMTDDDFIREFANMGIEIKELKNQQKEFIDYINSYIKLLSDDPDYIEERQKDILEEILSKYEDIIDK